MTFGDIELNTTLKASCHHYKKKKMKFFIEDFFIFCAVHSEESQIRQS